MLKGSLLQIRAPGLRALIKEFSGLHLGSKECHNTEHLIGSPSDFMIKSILGNFRLCSLVLFTLSCQRAGGVVKERKQHTCI